MITRISRVAGSFFSVLQIAVPERVGEHQIEQDEVRLELARQAQPLGSRRHQRDAVPLLREVVVEDLPEIGLVFDHQHAGHERMSRTSTGRWLDDRVTVA